MSDVIDRLRSDGPDFEDCDRAADEIERLRAELAVCEHGSLLRQCEVCEIAGELRRLRAELAECKQDAKHRITRLRDALANLHGNCYVADAPTEMIAAEEALAAEALDAARKGEGE